MTCLIIAILALKYNGKLTAHQFHGIYTLSFSETSRDFIQINIMMRRFYISLGLIGSPIPTFGGNYPFVVIVVVIMK